VASEPEPSTSRPLYQYIVAVTALLVALTGLIAGARAVFSDNGSSGSSSASAAGSPTPTTAATAGLAPSAKDVAVPTPNIVSSQKYPWGYILSGSMSPSEIQSGKFEVIVLAKDQATGTKYQSDPARVEDGGQWSASIGLPATATDLSFRPGVLPYTAGLPFTGPPSPQVVTAEPSFEATGKQYRP